MIREIQQGAEIALASEIIRQAFATVAVEFSLVCARTGQCIQRDDMDLLIADLLIADVVVMASPSYWGDVTAQLKTFIDRCTPLSNTRLEKTIVPPGKRGIAVAVRAGQSLQENQHIVDTIAHMYGHLGITLAASVTLEGIRIPADLTTEKLQSGYQIGRSIAHGKYEGDLLASAFNLPATGSVYEGSPRRTDLVSFISCNSCIRSTQKN